jgi:hypothetical protein
MLQGVLDAGEREAKHLQSVREKLEEDIERKRVSLEVDSEVLNMDAGWSATSKSEVLNRSSSLPHMWRQRTWHILPAVRKCNSLSRNRGDLRGMRAPACDVQAAAHQEPRHPAGVVQRRKEHARSRHSCCGAQSAGHQCAGREHRERACGHRGQGARCCRCLSSRFNSMNSFQLQINQADSTKISVEESLHAKHGPLALARSRLQIRTSRPAQEQVRVAPCFIRFPWMCDDFVSRESFLAPFFVKTSISLAGRSATVPRPVSSAKFPRLNRASASLASNSAG